MIYAEYKQRQPFLVRSFLLSLLVTLFILPVWAFAADSAEVEEDADKDAPQSRYVEIAPPFVTNYGNPDRLSYMKVEVTLRVLGAAGESQALHHMPYIQDTLLQLFAIQSRTSIGSAEGKDVLRLEALAQVSKILEEEDVTSYLEDILFTGFVAHR
jgi:flagellar FliL protein